MRRWALALVVALAVAACGKVSSPVAPERRVPAPVTNLRGVVEDGAIVLMWTNPQQRVDQSRLRDLSEVRVYRTEDEGVVPPKPALLFNGKVAGYQEIAVIPLGAPVPDAAVQGQAVRFGDRQGLRFGRRYTYVVLAEDGRVRISPPSNRFSITFIAPAEAPTAPTAEAGDGEVRVRWRPPSRLLDGGPTGPLAYEVLRASAEGAPPTVFPVPAGQTEFVDKSVENERTYSYAVRAIRQDGGTTARGPASPSVAATPGRSTPPAPPTNLVATPSANTVRLSWTPSADPSVAGYVVYRTGPTGEPARPTGEPARPAGEPARPTGEAARPAGEAARVGSVRAPATTFTDRDLSPGTYRYAVTAQDATARGNESGPSNEVSITLP